MFNVAENRSQNIDLRPVKSHINQNKLINARVNHGSNIFTLEVVLINSLEPVASECNNAQVSELVNDLKVLVPTVKHIVVQVQVHHVWDGLAQDLRFADLRDFHVLKRDVSCK